MLAGHPLGTPLGARALHLWRIPLGDEASPAAAEAQNAGDRALLAVSAELPVGIDCELERGRGLPLAIARRMFDPRAQAALAGLSGDALQRSFHLHWTALEARVKADGRGLARHREPDPEGLMVAHAIAGEHQGRIALCAVARRALPVPDQWLALELRADGGCR